MVSAQLVLLTACLVILWELVTAMLIAARLATLELDKIPALNV